MSSSKKKTFFFLFLLFCLYFYLFLFFEVRVVLYKNGSLSLSMSFKAVGTNRLDWFSEKKLLSSPWTDLKNASSLRHFNITGSHKRYFEITYQYDGCPRDAGWLVVGNGECSWERHGSSNYSSNIRFSNITRKTNWNHFSKRFFIRTRFQ